MFEVKQPKSMISKSRSNVHYNTNSNIDIHINANIDININVEDKPGADAAIPTAHSSLLHKLRTAALTTMSPTAALGGYSA